MGTRLHQRSIEHRVICDRVLKAFQCIYMYAADVLSRHFKQKQRQHRDCAIYYPSVTMQK